MKVLHAIAFILVIVGGVNWGLVGISRDWNLVELLLGNWMWLETIVYILVGLSAVYLAVMHRSECKHCENKSAQPMM